MCSFPYHDDFRLNAFFREQRTVPRWSLSWRLRIWELIWMLTHHENRQSIMQRCSARIFLKVISLILLVLQECSSEAVIKLHCHFKYCICVIPCLRSISGCLKQPFCCWSVPSPTLWHYQVKESFCFYVIIFHHYVVPLVIIRIWYLITCFHRMKIKKLIVSILQW